MSHISYNISTLEQIWITSGTTSKLDCEQFTILRTQEHSTGQQSSGEGVNSSVCDDDIDDEGVRVDDGVMVAADDEVVAKYWLDVGRAVVVTTVLVAAGSGCRADVYWLMGSWLDVEG